MNALNTFLLGLAGLAAVFTGVWLVQLKTRNAGIVDAVWAWSVGALGPWYAWNSAAPDTVRWMLAVMPAAWGLRLGWYLWERNHGKPEDGRYAQLRKEWGANANTRMLYFFQVQVVFAMLLSVGLLIVADREHPPSTPALLLAGILWIASVVGEAVADNQLAEYKKNPAHKGKVCREGLWYYSRHPNYFFEVLHWVAYVPLGLSLEHPIASLVCLIPPAVMTFLLTKMSGVPATEAQTALTRPDYAEYIRTTSALIPWPPKK